MYHMPKLDLDAANLTKEERELAQGILATQGPNKGNLRASKPKVTRTKMADGTWQREGGEMAYIWRNVAFMVSPNPKHQCLPMMAFCDLPGEWGDEQRELAARLDDIADRIAATAPAAWLHGGVARWANLI